MSLLGLCPACRLANAVSQVDKILRGEQCGHLEACPFFLNGAQVLLLSGLCMKPTLQPLLVITMIWVHPHILSMFPEHKLDPQEVQGKMQLYPASRLGAAATLGFDAGPDDAVWKRLAPRYRGRLL